MSSKKYKVLLQQNLQLQFAPFQVLILFLKATTFFLHVFVSSLEAFRGMLPLNVRECVPKCMGFYLRQFCQLSNPRIVFNFLRAVKNP